MKVMVVHPGKQHVFQLVKALNSEGILDSFITTSYYKKGSLTGILIGYLPSKLATKAKKRRDDEIPDNKVIQLCEFRGLLCTFFRGYLPKKGAFKLFYPLYKKIYPKFNDYLNDCVGKKAGKLAIKRNVDVVISFDNNSSVLFEYLKKYAPHIKCILDCSIANREYAREVYLKDYHANNSEELMEEQKKLFDKHYMDRIRSELRNSDYFLAGSTFVKESLIYSKIEKEKIFVVHYGVNLGKFKFLDLKKSRTGLNLIYVGGMSYRKGLHHLFPVVRSLKEKGVTLTVVGEINPKSRLYLDYKNDENINFLGFLSAEKLNIEYNKADAFILPSLSEGMAMVGLEAMRCNLPILCSMNTGLTDVVENGINGIVFEAGNPKIIFNLLEKVCINKDELAQMGVEAGKVACNYSWNTYNRNIIRTMKIIGKES